MSDGTLAVLITICVAIIVVFIIIIIIKLNKKNMRKIVENVSPIWAEIVDLLILKVTTGEDTTIVYYPVFKSKRDDKIYIPAQYGNYGCVYPSIEGIFKEEPKIIIKNIKKEIIEFNKEGRLYIKKEKDKVKVEDNTIQLDHKKVTYAGKYKKVLLTNNLYNINNDNIMEILNEATLYEGIADFDMEGI
jgi:hypothetical protein